ncbi:MAG TPA: plastocyanin/azurin family copper-binding protein [Gammaproteobacteria bacterium]|nr:plastocyanin/azurin family copper-binding protein [Gammaproteobacteria bacterium]
MIAIARTVQSVSAPLWLRAGAVCVFFYASSTYAAEHEIRARGNQWAPTILFIEPGDSVIFVGMTGHETELIEGMGPENAMLWGSELGEEGFRVTFVEPGAYVYKCHVHLNAGMIGAIVVGSGEPRNMAEIDAALEDIDQGRAAVRRIVARMKREIASR